MFGELETFRLRWRSAQGDRRSDCHSERSRRRSRGIPMVGRAWTRAIRTGECSVRSRCFDFGAGSSAQHDSRPIRRFAPAVRSHPGRRTALKRLSFAGCALRVCIAKV